MFAARSMFSPHFSCRVVIAIPSTKVAQEVARADMLLDPDCIFYNKMQVWANLMWLQNWFDTLFEFAAFCIFLRRFAAFLHEFALENFSTFNFIRLKNPKAIATLVFRLTSELDTAAVVFLPLLVWHTNLSFEWLIPFTCVANAMCMWQFSTESSATK